MKENSIEEALEKLSTGKKIKMYELLRTFEKEGIENFVITRKKYVDVILLDYKRVLKENEILKEEKLQAWEEWNNLEQGSYETERRLKKENETLKEYIAKTPNLDEMTAIKYRNIQQEAYIQGRAEEQQKAEQIINENYIPIKKVKDKIEHYQKLQDNYIEKYDEIKESLQSMINALQELLEGRK